MICRRVIALSVIFGSNAATAWFFSKCSNDCTVCEMKSTCSRCQEISWSDGNHDRMHYLTNQADCLDSHKCPGKCVENCPTGYLATKLGTPFNQQGPMCYRSDALGNLVQSTDHRAGEVSLKGTGPARMILTQEVEVSIAPLGANQRPFVRRKADTNGNLRLKLEDMYYKTIKKPYLYQLKKHDYLFTGGMFKFSCMCPGESSDVPKLTAVQEMNSVKLNVKFKSYCAKHYVLERDDKHIIDKIELPEVWTCEARIYDTSFDLGQRQAGDEVKFCARAQNDDMDDPYVTEENCVTITVQFQAVVDGFISFEDGITGVPDVTVYYATYDTAPSTVDVQAWWGKAGSEKKSVNVGNDGRFSLDIQTNYSGAARTILMYPFYEHLGRKHTFDCGYTTESENCHVLDDTEPGDDQTKGVVYTFGHNSENTLNFIDKTGVKLSGRILVDGTQDHTQSGERCPFPGAQVCAERPNAPTICSELSADDGVWSVSVPSGADVKLTPRFNNIFPVESSTFNASMFQPLFEEKNNVVTTQGIDFFISERISVQIQASAGKCGVHLGEIDFQIGIPTCPDFQMKKTLQASQFSMSLSMPISNYTVQLAAVNSVFDGGVVQDVLDYFENINTRKEFLDTQKIEDGMVEAQFRYRAPLDLFIEFPHNYEPCSGYVVVETRKPYDITIKASETYGTSGLCSMVDESTISFQDLLSEPSYDCSTEECSISIGGTEAPVSQYATTVIPGLKNGWDRSLVVKYSDKGRPANPIELNAKVMVTGFYGDGVPESVKISDEVPILILYDPPGSGSFASITSGTTLTSEIVIAETTGKDSSWGLKGGIMFDHEMTSCVGVGVYVCSKASATSNLATTGFVKSITEDGTKENTYKASFTLEQTVTTSEEDKPGQDSDIVFVNAVSIQYTLGTDHYNSTDDDGTCKHFERTQLQWRPEVTGLAHRSFYHIINKDIPKLEEDIPVLQSKIAANDYEDNEDGEELKEKDNRNLRRFKLGLERWENIVKMRQERHDGKKLQKPTDFYERIRCETAEATSDSDGEELDCEEKLDELFKGQDKEANSIFISGGGSAYTWATEWSAETAYSHTVTTDISKTLELEMENKVLFGVIGPYLDSFKGWEWRTSHAATTSNEQEKTTQVEFTLSDATLLDAFDVEVMYDADFNTPFFKTINGQSKCPHEKGTRKREDPVLELISSKSQFTDVPKDAEVEIKVKVINLSGTNEAADEFVLHAVTGSNQNGLQIKVAGTPLEIYRLRDVPPGPEGIQVVLTAQRSPGSYSYPDVALQLESDCDEDLFSTVSFSVDFLQHCSSIEFSGQILADKSFRVIKKDVEEDGTSTILVHARNPNNWDVPWINDARLQSRTVQYRRVGDTVWEDAAVLTSDEDGSSEVEVNVTEFSDGEYEMRLVAFCSSEQGPVGSHTSEVIKGVIDRVPIYAWTDFAEPSDKLWFPGDEISLSFSEEIDCRSPDEIQVEVVATKYGENFKVPKGTWDMRCNGKKLEFALHAAGKELDWDFLKNSKVSIEIKNVKDQNGNSMEEALTLEFGIEDFDSNLIVVKMGVRIDQDFSLYQADPNGFKQEILAEFQAATGAEDVEINSIKPGSIIVGVTFGSKGLQAARALQSELDAGNNRKWLGQAKVEASKIMGPKTSDDFESISSACVFCERSYLMTTILALMCIHQV